MDMDCTIYMGAADCERQALNVFRMKMLGAKVVPVESGSRTLKDAINEAMRDWVTNVRTTHYLIGSAIGPHPFPTIVRDFQAIIGKEARQQILEMTGKLPDVVSCSGSKPLIYLFLFHSRDRVHGPLEPTICIYTHTYRW